MPVFTIKEISEKCSIEPKNIHVYVGRGKLVLNKHKQIDDTIPINMDFIQSHEVKSTKEPSVIHKPVITKHKKIKKGKSKPIEQSITSVEIDSNKNDEPDFDLTYVSENELRKLKAEKLKEDIILARLRNEKVEGKLIPTDLVQMAIGEVIQRYKMTSVQETEQLLRDTLNEIQASNEVITKACSRNVELSNQAFSRAIIESKQAIKNCISESLSLNS